MDKNVNLYNAAWHLIAAADLMKKYDKKMSDELLDKATEVTNKIEVNKQEIEEIDEYERKLRDEAGTVQL